MDMAPASNGRMVVALGVLSVLALLVWRTMEPGKFQQLAWLVLGFCGFCVILSKWGIRKFGEKEWSESGQRGHVLPRKSPKG
jgi:drug/metabolite transporter (DMT)-like permease